MKTLGSKEGNKADKFVFVWSVCVFYLNLIELANWASVSMLILFLFWCFFYTWFNDNLINIYFNGIFIAMLVFIITTLHSLTV